MTKLTEIVSEPGSYNAATRNVDSTYKLRTLYINPDFVVELRENKDHACRHTDKKLVPGLSKDVGFSRVIVSSGGNWVKTYDVVGYPEQILMALKEG